MAHSSKKYDRIFGTPPEPLFNLHPQCMSVDLLAECLHVMAADNITAMEQATCKAGYFLVGKPAECVFQICRKLNVQSSVKYLAIELFEKFMTAHLRELYAYAFNQKNTSGLKEWMVIQQRVENQMPLRMISCCQLASKLTAHYEVVSTETARRLLTDLGHKYSRDSLLQSELRVLKTLSYKVNVASPLLYVETLLEVMGHNDKAHNVKIYHGVCVKILDLLYLRGREVYDHLFNIATGHLPTSTSDMQKMATLKKDHMLKAAAVITASSYIVNKRQTDKVIDGLSTITKLSNDDVLDFATVIIHQIIPN